MVTQSSLCMEGREEGLRENFEVASGVAGVVAGVTV